MYEKKANSGTKGSILKHILKLLQFDQHVKKEAPSHPLMEGLAIVSESLEKKAPFSR